MKNKIVSFCIFMSFFVFAPTTMAEKQPTKDIKPTISDLIALNADKYNVSERVLYRIINCESEFQPTVQSHATYKKGNKWGFKPGTREKSFGLVQIHLPDNPGVTKTQANDPSFAVDFLAKNIAHHTNHWTCQKT